MEGSYRLLIIRRSLEAVKPQELVLPVCFLGMVSLLHEEALKDEIRIHFWFIFRSEFRGKCAGAVSL